MRLQSPNQGLIWTCGASGLAPIFSADLKTSIIPQKGELLSFTRASTATIVDHEGLVRNVLTDEARFYGARRVENLHGGLLAPFNAASVIQNFDKSYTVTNLSGNATDTALDQLMTSESTYNRTFVASFEIKGSAAQVASGSLKINVQKNSGSSTATQTIIPAISEDWVRYHTDAHTMTGISDTGIKVLLFGLVGGFELRNFQVEETTGRAITTPSEYVSKGVGTGVEKHPGFEDASTWNAASTGATIISNNLVSFVSATVNMNAILSFRNTQVLLGRNYVISFDITNYVSGTFRIDAAGSSSSQISTNGKHFFRVRATSTSFALNPLVSFTGDVSNLSFKEIQHGSNVDGVKYFATENANTVLNNVVTDAVGAAIPEATLKGFLSERSTTNLVLKSEYDAATWASNNMTFGGSVNHGDISLKAVVEGVGSSFYNSTLSTYFCVAGEEYTWSFYVKQLGAAREVLIAFTATFFTSAGIVFDLQSETSTPTGSITSASIDAVGDGVYLCTFTGIPDVTLTQPLTLFLAGSGTVLPYTGDGASGVYMGGLQVEAGVGRTSYIPTDGATSTRAGDLLQYEKGSINDTVGAAVAEIFTLPATIPAGEHRDIISVNSFGRGLLFLANNSGTWSTYDGTTSSQMLNSLAPDVNERSVGGVVWGSGVIQQYSDGVKDTTPAPFDGSYAVDELTIGAHKNSTTKYINCPVKNIKLYSKALPDAKMLELTT